MHPDTRYGKRDFYVDRSTGEPIEHAIRLHLSNSILSYQNFEERMLFKVSISSSGRFERGLIQWWTVPHHLVLPAGLEVVRDSDDDRWVEDEKNRLFLLIPSGFSDATYGRGMVVLYGNDAAIASLAT